MSELATIDVSTGEIVSVASRLPTPTAKAINREHQLAQSCADTAVEHGIRCGQLLVIKKSELGHGKFQSWVNTECEFAYSTAARYMKAAKQNSTGVEISSLRQLFVSGHNHRAQYTGEHEWYTPPEYVEAARKAMGGIDLDPASSELAQQTIKASEFFTAQRSGLIPQWHGRVWMNPPYAQPLIAQFIQKAIDEFTAGSVEQAIVLTHNSTDTAWFHSLEKVAARLCFTRGRIAFVDPQGERCAPTQGQAFFYCGPHPERFAEVFSEFGFIR